MRDHEHAVGRIPVGAHRAPHAEDLDRAGQAGKAGAEREGGVGELRDGEPGMDGGARIGADDLQLEAEGGAGHQEMDEQHGDDRQDDAAVDGRVAEARQAVGPRSGSRSAARSSPDP